MFKYFDFKSALKCVLLFFVVFWLVKKYLLKPSSTGGYVDGLAVDKTKLSLTTSTLDSITVQLYNAMNGLGTNEKLILQLFQRLTTKDDLNYIIKKFGIKKYSAGGQSNAIGGLVWGDELDLIGWLRKELNETDLVFIRKEFRRLKNYAL